MYNIRLGSIESSCSHFQKTIFPVVIWHTTIVYTARDVLKRLVIFHKRIVVIVNCETPFSSTHLQMKQHVLLLKTFHFELSCWYSTFHTSRIYKLTFISAVKSVLNLLFLDSFTTKFSTNSGRQGKKSITNHPRETSHHWGDKYTGLFVPTWN